MHWTLTHRFSEWKKRRKKYIQWWEWRWVRRHCFQILGVFCLLLLLLSVVGDKQNDVEEPWNSYKNGTSFYEPWFGWLLFWWPYPIETLLDCNNYIIWLPFVTVWAIEWRIVLATAILRIPKVNGLVGAAVLCCVPFRLYLLIIFRLFWMDSCFMFGNVSCSNHFPCRLARLNAPSALQNVYMLWIPIVCLIFSEH